MASLAEIKRVATYEKKNITDLDTKIKEIDIENSIITTRIDSKDMTISDEALDQLMEMMKIKVPIRYLMRRFKTDKKQTQIKLGYVKRMGDIIEDIITFGIKRQTKPFRLIYDKRKNHILGSVSMGYTSLDNLDVIEACEEIYGSRITENLSYINNRTMSVFFDSDVEAITPIIREKIRYGYIAGNSRYGWASASVFEAMTFLRCVNGQKLAEIKLGERIIHRKKDIKIVFKKTLGQWLNDPKILNIIDKWASRPARFSKADLEDDAILVKLDAMLTRYGITKKEYREGIIDIIKEDQVEEHNINGYWIGNAVNNYASHQIGNSFEAMALMLPAYNLMTMP